MFFQAKESHLTYTWDITVNAPVDDVWALIADTDKINKLLGLPSVMYKDHPTSYGGSTRQANVHTHLMDTQWEEKPFEWIANQFYSVERNFLNGLMKSLYMSVELQETQIGIMCHFTFKIIPSFSLMKSLIDFVFNTEVKKRYETILKALENTPNPYSINTIVAQKDNNSSLKTVLQKYLPIFNKCSPDHNLTLEISTYIFSALDIDLQKIRPFKLAQELQKDKKATLELFLRGTKHGLFNMSWDLLCPNCRVAKASHADLSSVTKTVHCDTCNINFEVEFDKSVELTFTPHPLVRKINNTVYCMGGPGNNTFIVSQMRLKKNENKTLLLDLTNGYYKITSPQLDYQVNIQVFDDPHGDQAIHLIFEKTPQSHIPSLTCQQGKITFHFLNQTIIDEILVKVEKKQWIDNIVTAHYVTNLQEFRDLFSSEVLKPGENIQVQSIALMFTDLKGSTKFYDHVGSAKAYSIVRDHFKLMREAITNNNGALIKTIGDAVMGSFSIPSDAFLAALDIQKNIQEFNENLGELAITVKIGLHFGPALAVNQDDTLDYFGSTVNIAARIESQSHGKDVIITEDFYQAPDIQDIIHNRSLKTETFPADLKGFDQEFQLVRILLES